MPPRAMVHAPSSPLASFVTAEVEPVEHALHVGVSDGDTAVAVSRSEAERGGGGG
jgi:hypothetical protein